jgi:hypothetical protein
MILRAFVLVLAVAAAPGLAQAQQFRWIDQSGKAQFGDAPPPGAKQVTRTGPVAAKPAAAAAATVPFEIAEAQKNFPVTLYTSPICKGPCEQARGLLNKRGIPFNELQVWNPETLEQLKKASNGDTVPSLVVGRSAQSGFDPNRYGSLLDSAGYPPAGAYPARAQAAPALPEGYEPPPVAEPAAASDAGMKAGPYDTSGLVGPPPKAPLYDSSTLVGPPPKPGQYGLPGESK